MIKWTGHSTSGNWHATVKANDMHDLFHKLANEPLHDGDYLISTSELYSTADNEWSDVAALATEEVEDQKYRLIYNKIYAMNDRELEKFIRKFNRQAYYQTFIDIDDLEQFKKLMIDTVTHLNEFNDDMIENIESVDHPKDLPKIEDGLRTWSKDLESLADKVHTKWYRL